MHMRQWLGIERFVSIENRIDKWRNIAQSRLPPLFVYGAGPVARVRS